MRLVVMAEGVLQQSQQIQVMAVMVVMVMTQARLMERRVDQA